MRLCRLIVLCFMIMLVQRAEAVTNLLAWCGAGGDDTWQVGETVGLCDMNAIKTAHNATDARVTALEAVDNITAAEATTEAKTWLASPTAANLRAALTGSGVTGVGVVVYSNSPTLVSPSLGTPNVLHLNNADLLPMTGISGLGTGVATWLAGPSSANLNAALSDKTGTGLAVFGTNSVLDKPSITSKLNLPHVTADPAAPANGDTAVFTNTSAVGACDHTGSSRSLCYYTGSAWASLGDGGSGGGATALDDLTDVVISAPADKNALVYNGTNWAKGQIDLSNSAAVTGNMTSLNFNGGTDADTSHFLRGDMTWQVPPGAGTVTHTGATFVADELPCFADTSGDVLKRCLAGAKLNSTGLTIAADSTDGQSLTLAEDTSFGTGVFKLTVGQTNLPDATTTCTLDSNGKIPTSCLSAGASGLASTDIDTSEELWDIVSAATARTGTRASALVFAGSPALTGVPTTPTAAGTDDTTQIASTAQVHLAIQNDVSPPPAFCAPYTDVLGNAGVSTAWTFWRPGIAVHLTEVWCRSDSGTTFIQLQKDDGAPVNMFAAGLTCNTNGGIQNVFEGTENAIGNTDWINVNQYGNGETQLTVCVKYTID